METVTTLPTELQNLINTSFAALEDSENVYVVRHYEGDYSEFEHLNEDLEEGSLEFDFYEHYFFDIYVCRKSDNERIEFGSAYIWRNNYQEHFYLEDANKFKDCLHGLIQEVYSGIESDATLITQPKPIL